MGSNCYILHLSGTVRGSLTRFSFTCGCKSMVGFCSALQIAKAAEGAGYTAPSGLIFQVINPLCESGYFVYTLKIFL